MRIGSLVLCVSWLLVCRAAMAAEAETVGFLAPEASAAAMGPEAQAAWQLAQKLGPARLVFAAGGGKFVDQQGQEVALDQFAVVWCHQGDATEPAEPLSQAATTQALRKYVGEGHGLFLSGAALAMVHTLGIEPIPPRRGGPGSDKYVAQLIPAEAKHPALQGLVSAAASLSEGPVPISDAGFPAYADFAGSGGPTRGMLLARANCGDENPLVEYGLDKGRVIVLGWRLPHYSNATNSHRANLERLTQNIVSYLGDAAQWQPIVVTRVPRPAAAEPGLDDHAWESLDLAIQDLIDSFGKRYPQGPEWLKRLRALKDSRDALRKAKSPSAEQQAQLQAIAKQFQSLKQEALLANPLVDFDRLLVIERGAGRLGLPANWQSNSCLPQTGYDNRLAVLSPVRPNGQLSTLYQPEGGRFVGDVDLHFDADRLLFSMPGANGRWQVFEMRTDGSGLHELPLILQPDVDNYDACYLPDGRIVFTSTAPFVGVPCVYGGSHVTNMYLLETDGSIRQLTVDQEHNWCPTVANNGRILYLRWEYADLPHSHSRILFDMNPDGTGQMEYFGSNSYFVNSFFYARPIPGHATKVVGIATGHHGNARIGRLLVVDPARGRHEADGVVQEIPGRGKKVEPIIRDPLADGAWPQFLHPYPLSEKYFLVAAKPTPGSFWGIYLVDVFDNMTLVYESPGYAMLEPIPLRKTPKPPAIPDRIDRRRTDALVYMTDVYTGGGLKGIPRGTVKKLRLVSYTFSYRGMGGLLGAIGMDGPWDVKRVLGTVPVEPDGSALFRVPANTPIAVQPLDEDGRALQLMRSWFTAMPGETLTCVGCHERQNSATPNRQTVAARRAASEIAPWHGPVRGFSFAREVQPTIDRYCVGCHNGQPAPGGTAPDLRGTATITDWNSDIAGHVSPAVGGKFSVAYAELHRYVRRPGIESDIHMLSPMDFSAGTTELVQMLKKGHHNVRIDAEGWDRLYTWIDLNAPYHGTWTEIAGEAQVKPVATRAREMRKLYANVDEDPEAIPPAPSAPVEPVMPEPLAEKPASPVTCPGWPFDAQEAKRRQTEAGAWQQAIDLGGGVTLEMVRIPAGEFVMGDPQGEPDERPCTRVNIARPFWMGRCEVTNEQFARFDPAHDSHVEVMHGYQFGMHGYPLDGPKQPAVRLSWNEAVAFCQWLSAKTGRKSDLPSEAQWEYACRAGTATPFWFGNLDTDFSPSANLGDVRLREFALDTYVNVRILANPNKYDDWVPKDERFDDRGFVSVDVGRYQTNPWGLCDVHGNVWEWTRSLQRPYPYDESDGRNDPAASGLRVVRGGSWYDRPKRCRSAFRLAYEPYQPAFNVGFRVVMEE